jgi:hypothetical protein
MGESSVKNEGGRERERERERKGRGETSVQNERGVTGGGERERGSPRCQDSSTFFAHPPTNALRAMGGRKGGRKEWEGERGGGRN